MGIISQIASWASDMVEDVSSAVSKAIETAQQPKLNVGETIEEAVATATDWVSSTVQELLNVEPEPEPQLEADILELGSDNLEAVTRVLAAAEEDLRNADLVAAARDFDEQLASASDEDMAETAISALTDLVTNLSESTREEIKQIVGERAFNLMSLDFPSPKDMVCQYLTSLINGGATEAGAASVMLSVAYARMSDSDRDSFLSALQLASASLGLTTNTAVAATGMIATLLDTPAVGGVPWWQTLGGVPHLCVPITGTSYVCCFATSRVKGLDVRVFSLREGQLERVAGSGLSKLLKGAPTGVLNAATALLTSGFRADALEAAYDRSLLDDLLQRLTAAGYQMSKTVLNKALDYLADAPPVRPQDGDSVTPVAGEDETEVVGTSVSGVTPSPEIAPSWARKRDMVLQKEAHSTAYQRGHARRAIAVADQQRAGEGE